jgi:tRNA nucleotidyltransferase/poly(A) polymerase
MTLADEVIERVSAIVNPVYLVGGSVRDALMGRACTDFDFSTPLGPELIESAVRAAGKRPYLMGKRFGTVAFRLDGFTIEVTTFRSESYLPGSRRPNVEFLPDLERDLGRRDFTMNAMARHGDELIDLFGGRADLEAGLVRAVGDPAERFAEDPLRMLRAARFVSQLDFSLDEGTRLAARELAPAILAVARERWMIELDRLLVGPGVESSLQLLADTRLISFLLPEVGLQSDMVSLDADSSRSLFDETVVAVGSAPNDVTARWAALLMHVGQAYLPEPGAGEDEFRGGSRRARALLAAEIVERTALYLKWSNRRREEVTRLVAEGQPDDA